MNSGSFFKKVHLLFFLSGFASLSYQIVWTRLLLYTFGNTTYSIVAVLAAFMAGLGLGGYIFGKLSSSLKYPLRIFAYIELGVGMCAVLLPSVFSYLDKGYVFIINTGILPTEAGLVLLKFLITSLVILPVTTLMGGTFPLVLSYFAKMSKNYGSITGSLYAINTAGAIIGVIYTAFLGIELLGLRHTVYTTALINLLIFLSLYKSPIVFPYKLPDKKPDHTRSREFKTMAVILLYGISGITSMALEVLWIRLLTPTVGTYIYAFSLILVTFLGGLVAGSYFYKEYEKKVTRVFKFLGCAELTIALSAFFSVIISASGVVPLNTFMQTVAIVFPGTFAMGTILPAITQLSKQGELGSFIGKALFSNCLGSTLGPIIAGFLLIPWLGTTRSILIISASIAVIAAILFTFEKNPKTPTRATAIASLAFSFLVMITIYLNKDTVLRQRFIKHQMALHKDNKTLFLEDEVATVFAFSGSDYTSRGLIIDGVETTRLVAETKLIAHLPLLIHPHPRRILIIALGMGTTFRSSLTHNIEQVKVVELVPSVVKTFSLFHEDGETILKDDRGKIVVNDGRQFVHTTEEFFDVVTIDPPPPVNSAGTTVLYSQEFYQDIKKRLNPDGMVQQWFLFDTTTQEKELKILINTIIRQFKYAWVFSSPSQLGISVIASDSPLVYNQMEFSERLKQPRILADLSEWKNTPKTVDEFLNLYVGGKDVLERFIDIDEVVTDDRPRTEYFLVNRVFTPTPFINPREVNQKLIELNQIN